MPDNGTSSNGVKTLDIHEPGAGGKSARNSGPNWTVGLGARFTGEVVGTYLMVMIGTASVAAAAIAGAQMGLWQVAVVWTLGVSVSIYATANVSGAHLNPAVTLAFAIFRRGDFDARLIPVYWAAQLAGGILAGLTVLGAFGSLIGRFESENGLTRGEAGSERSAMAFGEYFPNPAMYGVGEEAAELISPLGAMFVEAFGTAILALVIFAVTDRRNAGLTGNLAPLLIGGTVGILISLFAPLTQAGWNPARDFGPRIVAFFAGWGEVAIPGPRGGFWIYIVGPLIGAPIGAAAHEFLLKPGLKLMAKAEETDEAA